MKKFISILLLCSLACGLFIACSSGKTESTTTPKVTTTAPSRPNDDLIDVKDDVVIVERKTLTYKYQAVEVTWTDNSYYTRDTDGFSQFVADNANWFAKDFDDSSWTTWASETDGYIGDRLDNLGEGRAASDWNGDNHGLFARTSFNLDQQYSTLIFSMTTPCISTSTEPKSLFTMSLKSSSPELPAMVRPDATTGSMSMLCYSAMRQIHTIFMKATLAICLLPVKTLSQ